MKGLEIIVKDFDGGPQAEIRKVGIRSNGVFLTKLYRVSSTSEDMFLRASPAQLAFWILDNWWRILHEPEPAGTIDADWLLAHEVSAIGGGIAWPPIRIWNEGSQVGIQIQPLALNSVGPVRYDADYYGLVPRADVERSFDDFLNDEDQCIVVDKDILSNLHEQVKRERSDPEVSIWRIIEAKLGYDVDTAPVSLMERLDQLILKFGQATVSEACMSCQGSQSVRAFEEGLLAVKNSRIKLNLSTGMDAAQLWINQGTAMNSYSHHDSPPWKLAEDAAAAVRGNSGIPSGRISDRNLLDLLGISTHSFNQIRGLESIPYGMRRQDQGQTVNTVALKAGRSQAKRFQLCRVLGDAIWSANDRLGIISSAKSVRQKFQRAFAQNLLCPLKDLMDYIGTDSPSSDDITAAAQRFRVSERLVRSTLVNNGALDRDRLCG